MSLPKPPIGLPVTVQLDSRTAPHWQKMPFHSDGPGTEDSRLHSSTLTSPSIERLRRIRVELSPQQTLLHDKYESLKRSWPPWRLSSAASLRAHLLARSADRLSQMSLWSRHQKLSNLSSCRYPRPEYSPTASASSSSSSSSIHCNSRRGRHGNSRQGRYRSTSPERRPKPASKQAKRRTSQKGVMTRLSSPTPKVQTTAVTDVIPWIPPGAGRGYRRVGAVRDSRADRGAA